MSLTQKVQTFIRRHCLIKPADTLLLGVSGGADSTALAHLLHEMRYDFAINLRIAHFNHKMRPGAGQDQKFVEQLAAGLNIPCTVGVRKASARSSQISEDQARQWRLDFLLKTAKRFKAQAIVLAHTENDLAETVLMRLIRGAGLSGLRGIMAERQMKGVKLIRPLLGVQRGEIETYLARRKIKYCQDETNLQKHYLRNKIRLDLLPHLAQEYNPNIHHVLVDLAQTSSEDYDYLNRQVIAQFKQNIVSLNKKAKIKIDHLNGAHPAIRRMMLRFAFERLTGDTQQLTFSHVREAEELLALRPTGAIVHWPKSVKVRTTNNFLCLWI